MIAVKLKRDFITSAVNTYVALLIAICLLQFVETSADTEMLQQKRIINSKEEQQQNKHMPAFEQQQQEQQTHLTYGDRLSGLSYETIHHILRDENVSGNQLQEDDETNWQIYEISHDIRRRSATPTASSYLQLSARNLSDFNALRDLDADHMHTNELNLSWNTLKSVNLSSLHALQRIDLSHNQLTELPIDLFVGNQSQVKVLNLNNNRIRRGAPTMNFYLSELYLSGNEIEQLTALNLTLFKVLEILDLSCNHIKNLEGVFFTNLMHNLKYLNLADNQLNTIYREHFHNLLNLNSMMLSYNNISDIHFETFLALPNLQYLDLSHNQLKGESIRALQGIPDLIYLSIAHNAEVGVYMQEFVASWSLKQLEASGTSLCKIPAILAQSVRMLKLTDNWLKVIIYVYDLFSHLELSSS